METAPRFDHWCASFWIEFSGTRVPTDVRNWWGTDIFRGSYLLQSSLNKKVVTWNISTKNGSTEWDCEASLWICELLNMGDLTPRSAGTGVDHSAWFQRGNLSRMSSASTWCELASGATHHESLEWKQWTYVTHMRFVWNWKLMSEILLIKVFNMTSYCFVARIASLLPYWFASHLDLPPSQFWRK